MKLNRQAHVVYETQYHLVWVTRYRKKILVPGVAESLKKVLRAVREFHQAPDSDIYSGIPTSELWVNTSVVCSMRPRIVPFMC
jgi:hypothetical protein